MVLDVARLTVTVDADVDAARKGLSSVDSSIDQTTKNTAKLGKQGQASGAAFADGLSPIPLGMAGVGIAALAMGKSVFNAASDMEENINKVNVVFDEGAEGIRRWADDAATNLGLSESAALSAAGTFGNLLTSMGLTTPAASDMSKGIIELAADLGSFNNIGTDEALEKIRAGLVGETEPLRALGVNLSAASIQAKALEMGLAGTTAELTPAMKAQAAYALMLEQTTNAQGDFARTSDGAANSMKIAQATIDDLKVELGQGLVPVVALLAQHLTESAKQLNSFVGVVNSAIGPLKSLNDAIPGEPLSKFVDIMLHGGPAGYVMSEAVGFLAGKVGELREETVSLGDALSVKMGIEQAASVITHGHMETLLIATENAHALRDAYARQAEAAGLANDRASDLRLGLELGTTAAGAAAFQLDVLTTAADAAAVQQGILNGEWDAATAALGFWETNLKNAEAALALLSDEQTENGALTAEQQAQYDILTGAVDRYRGGIEDSEGAVIDATVAQALLVAEQDNLNTALSEMPATAVTEVSTPGAAESTEQIYVMQSAIDAVPRSFTITPNVNLDPFYAGMIEIRDNMPFSPAKKGPLSKVPDWDYLTWTVPRAMDTGVMAIHTGGAEMAKAGRIAGMQVGEVFVDGMVSQIGPSTGSTAMANAVTGSMGVATGIVTGGRGGGSGAVTGAAGGGSGGVAGQAGSQVGKVFVDGMVSQVGSSTGGAALTRAGADTLTSSANNLTTGAAGGGSGAVTGAAGGGSGGVAGQAGSQVGKVFVDGMVSQIGPTAGSDAASAAVGATFIASRKPVEDAAYIAGQQAGISFNQGFSNQVGTPSGIAGLGNIGGAGGGGGWSGGPGPGAPGGGAGALPPAPPWVPPLDRPQAIGSPNTGSGGNVATLGGGGVDLAAFMAAIIDAIRQGNYEAQTGVM